MDVYKKFSGQPQSSTHFFLRFHCVFLLNLSSLPPRGESKGRSHPAGVLLCALCTQQGAAQFMPWTKRFDEEK